MLQIFFTKPALITAEILLNQTPKQKTFLDEISLILNEFYFRDFYKCMDSFERKLPKELNKKIDCDFVCQVMMTSENEKYQCWELTEVSFD